MQAMTTQVKLKENEELATFAHHLLRKIVQGQGAMTPHEKRVIPEVIDNRKAQPSMEDTEANFRRSTQLKAEEGPQRDVLEHNAHDNNRNATAKSRNKRYWADAPNSNLRSPCNNIRPKQSEFARQRPDHKEVDQKQPTAREAHPPTAELSTHEDSDQQQGASHDSRNVSSSPTGSSLGSKVHGIGQGKGSMDSLPNLIKESNSDSSSNPSYDSSESGIRLAQGSFTSSTESSSQRSDNEEDELPQPWARGTLDPEALRRAGSNLFCRGDLEGATTKDPGLLSLTGGRPNEYPGYRGNSSKDYGQSVHQAPKQDGDYKSNHICLLCNVDKRWVHQQGIQEHLGSRNRELFKKGWQEFSLQQAEQDRACQQPTNKSMIHTQNTQSKPQLQDASARQGMIRTQSKAASEQRIDKNDKAGRFHCKSAHFASTYLRRRFMLLLAGTPANFINIKTHVSLK